MYSLVIVSIIVKAKHSLTEEILFDTCNDVVALNSQYSTDVFAIAAPKSSLIIRITSYTQVRKYLDTQTTIEIKF
jgi:hypothetical protein